MTEVMAEEGVLGGLVPKNPTLIEVMTPDIVLSVEGLTKYYGHEYRLGSRRFGRGLTKAVENISFTVQKGEIFGFLGPNGAGKSTTMRTIMGYLKNQGGGIKVFGMDHEKDALAIRHFVGYLPGDVAIYDNFTGNELISFFGQFRPIDNKLLSKLKSLFKVNLTKNIGSLSTGNRQQAALIAVLASNPDLLILDEPIRGLDPLMAARFHRLLKELRDQGKTIFLSSHDLAEVQKICDRVGIIKNGRMVVIERVEALLEKSLQEFTIEFPDPSNTPSKEILRALPNVVSVERKKSNGKYHLKVQGDINELLKFVSDFPIKRLTITDSSLEEIFLHYYADELLEGV
ncbi:MAG: ATP-binding cassette domain-containing protein [Candidatus Heimdallarchaeota archaeon]